jgi:hypothetical protein
MAIKTFTPEVQHTLNYKQFKLLPGNRPITDFHVRELAESYQSNPNLIELRPILVNERMEIVDGQHRLRACEMTKIEAPYIVAPGLTVGAAQIMNALQKPWKLLDFARSYSYSGNPEYQAFERYLDEYGLTPTTTLKYIHNADRNKATARFKIGAFKMPEDIASIDTRFGMLSSFGDFKGLPWKTDRFAKAFLTAMNLEGYDHPRMLRNMTLALPTVKIQADKLEWLRELERVYNYNIKSDTSMLRFF